MATSFRIPKSNDLDLVAALKNISDALKSDLNFNIIVNAPFKGEILVEAVDGGGNELLKALLGANSQAAKQFLLRTDQGHNALTITRHAEDITDNAQINDEWVQHAFNQNAGAQLRAYVKLVSIARDQLKSSDVEAAMKGSEDNSWNRIATPKLQF